MSFLYSTFLAITVLIGYGRTYPLSQFYPFGATAGDSNLPANDDGSTSSIHISVPFPFFGSSYSSVFVSALYISCFIIIEFKTPNVTSLDFELRSIYGKLGES